MLVLKIVSFYLIAQISAQDSAETVVANAAFEDIAPCPCDLSQGSCDVSCCCDNDCSANEKQTFVSCIPYLAGGQEPQTQQYRCSSTHHQKEDWFPFLCVEFEYNAFLGYFYEWQYKLGNNTQAFLDRLSTVFYFSYREQDARAIVDPNTTVYKFGASVKTRRQSASRIGTLSLPQQVLTGQCLDTAPVRYLKNLDHSCTVRMSVDLCSATSVLSQLYYVQSSTFTSFFSVVEDYSGITVAQTNVVYKCVTNENDLNRYLMSMTPLTVDSSQPSNLQIDPACVGDCGEDLCVNLTRSDPVVPQTVIGNCASQSPQAPTVNAGVCANAVIDVQYNAYWIGNKIAKFDAVIIVANISINNILGSPNVLTQNFKVDFIHNSTNATGEVSDNFYNITDASYTRSGKVGYEKGRGLYSGSAVYNTSTSPRQFLFVNSNGSRQMAVYRPGPDGLCENAGRRNIKFGEDITTACKLQLSIANMSDCTVLRRQMIYYLNSLMPSDVLGRRGYNDIYNQAYWIPVLREDLNESCTLASYFPKGESPVDNRTGICFNITSGIHLEVFYGETGRSNGFPIYEVLGSKVSYTNTTWSVKCSGPAGGVCRPNSTMTQQFQLTSSVRFTQIPPQTPTPVSKYYETPREDDHQLCIWGVCWDDLIHPFSRRYTADSREYVFGMISASIIFFIGYGLVARPFW